MVRLRAKGVTVSQIAARFGTYSASVLNATNNVMNADLCQSGEKWGEVMKHCWRRK